MRPYDEQLETGQLAYEAFHRSRTRRDGGSWVWWKDLPEETRDDWRAAAREVIQRGWVDSRRRVRGA